MTLPSRRFDPAEILGAGSGASEDELAAALAVARDLESVAATADGVHPAADFAATVMARVAREPAPYGAGLLAPVRAHPGLVGLLESLRDAWALVLSGARPVPMRATALAYVLALAVVGVSLTGLAAYGAAGAFGLLGPHSPTSGPSVAPALSPEPTRSAEPTTSPEPSPSPSVEPSPEPSESPGASDAAEPSESVGASSGAGGSSISTPRPASTPRSETPSPTSSDEHGGSSESPQPSPSAESN